MSNPNGRSTCWWYNTLHVELVKNNIIRIIYRYLLYMVIIVTIILYYTDYQVLYRYLYNSILFYDIGYLYLSGIYNWIYNNIKDTVYIARRTRRRESMLYCSDEWRGVDSDVVVMQFGVGILRGPSAQDATISHRGIRTDVFSKKKKNCFCIGWYLQLIVLNFRIFARSCRRWRG